MATKTRLERADDMKSLRYAGGMGHTFAAVRSNGIGLSGEFNSLESARRLTDAGDRIYERTAKAWRYVETKA